MINYMQTNILDLLEYAGEDICQNILSSFICPLNHDVENFIRTKAISFAKQKIAVSYLIFAEKDGQKFFIGYYTLANKFVCVNSSSLSKTMQKKIGKFSQYDAATDRYMVSMPLIAQLGKNYDPAIPIPIPGADLLQMVLDSTVGFFAFDKRIQQPEVSNHTDNILIQMLKYFNR